MKKAMKSLRATNIMNVIKDWDRSGFNKVEKARTTRMLGNLKHLFGNMTFAQFMHEWFSVQRKLMQQEQVGIYTTKLLKSYLVTRIKEAEAIDTMGGGVTNVLQPYLPMDGLCEDERDAELEEIMKSKVSNFPIDPSPEPTLPEWDETIPGIPLKKEDLIIDEVQKRYPIRLGEPADIKVSQTPQGTLIEIRTDRNPEVEVTVKIPYINIR